MVTLVCEEAEISEISHRPGPVSGYLREYFSSRIESQSVRRSSHRQLEDGRCACTLASAPKKEGRGKHGAGNKQLKGFLLFSGS